MRLCRKQPRGIALVIVLAVVAVSTVLAFALVGSQATLAQASHNSVKAMQADSLAESGVQLAAYYLQHPTAAPVLNAQGFYPGQTGVSLGSDIQGTVDITVTEVSSGTYDIACTANGGSASSLNRTVSARASVAYGYVPTEAFQINAALSLYSNMKITGSVRALGTVNVAAGATVTGTIAATSVLGSLLNVGATAIIPAAAAAPVPASVPDYKTYTYKGKTYSAQLLGVGITSAGPTATNPMGVYYTAGDRIIDKNLNITGTLISDGKLTIKTTTVSIDAMHGMPALIAKSDIIFSGSSRNMFVTGLSWINGSVTKAGLLGSGNNIKFDGAVQFAAAGAISSLFSGNVNISYSPEKAVVPNFVAGVNNTIYSVKLTSFSSSVSN
jgi:Tfp pilus assembly protein PilX